jgi:hypothetical protein
VNRASTTTSTTLLFAMPHAAFSSESSLLHSAPFTAPPPVLFSPEHALPSSFRRLRVAPQRQDQFTRQCAIFPLGTLRHPWGIHSVMLLTLSVRHVQSRRKALNRQRLRSAASAVKKHGSEFRSYPHTFPCAPFRSRVRSHHQSARAPQLYRRWTQMKRASFTGRCRQRHWRCSGLSFLFPPILDLTLIRSVYCRSTLPLRFYSTQSSLRTMSKQT